MKNIDEVEYDQYAKYYNDQTYDKNGDPLPERALLFLIDQFAVQG